MGIKDLSRLIADVAPNAIKEHELKAYFGRKVAIDASMSIYQFLIAVRQDGSNLSNEAGETTSHLMGLFYRTIRLIEAGLKPLYVFDGAPPEMKGSELEKRAERREEAEAGLAKAKEAGDDAAVDKFSRRLVKVTKEHNSECQRLLNLMGVPFVLAPTEAEAQCAALVKAGKVWATGTEDMDALTFGSSVLLRNLTASEARKLPVKEFQLEPLLKGLEMSQAEFIDLCILLGCDYCGTIRGIGPKKALDLMKKHRSIEAILKHLDKSKYPPPEEWNFEGARQLFAEPKVDLSEEAEFKWTEPDTEGLVSFMCTEKGFAEDRIRRGAEKLCKSRKGGTQGRIDSFFTLKPANPDASAKRKASEAKVKKTPQGGAKKPRTKPK